MAEVLPKPQPELPPPPVLTDAGPGGVGLVPPVIVITTTREPVRDVALVALTTTLLVPAVVGVPLIRPLAFIDRPAGSVLVEKLVGEVKLVAVIW